MNRKRTTADTVEKACTNYFLCSRAAFLLVAVIFSVKGFLRSSAEPSTIPSQNVTAPMPSLTPSPSGVESPDPAASDPTPTATTPTTAPVASPTPVGNISYEVKTMKQDDIYQGKLILINANHPYRFFDFENFVCLYNYKTDSYKVGDYDLLIAEDAIAPLNRMLNDFYYNTGVNAVLATSGHRTYEYQQYLFDKEVALVGPEEAALWVAQPGASEHHSGLAIDFAVYYDSGEYHDYDGSATLSINETATNMVILCATSRIAAYNRHCLRALALPLSRRPACHKSNRA